MDEVRTYTPDEIWDLFCRDWVVGLTSSIMVAMMLSALVVQANSREGLEWTKGKSSSADPESSNYKCKDDEENGEDDVHTPFLVEEGKNRSGDPAISVDRTKQKRGDEKTTPREDFAAAAEGRPVAFDFSRSCFGLIYYGFMCGLCSGFNSAVLKALVEFIKDGDDHHTEHLKNYPFWILLALLIPFIILQAWFLNQGLRRHESVLFVPPMTAFLIVCNAGAGYVYFDEGTNFSKHQSTYFMIGVAICVLGALFVMLHYAFPGGVEEKTKAAHARSGKDPALSKKSA
eukprot:g730.t1